MTQQDDTSLIIDALHKGPDLGKMGTSMLSLVRLSEEFRQVQKWSEALGCCDRLDDLVLDSDIRRIPAIDTTYASGMARMSRGAVYLSQRSLGDAETCFTEGRRCFQDASTGYSEAVAFLALALVHREQREWYKALVAVQPSLTILEHLGHPLKDDVLEILKEVQDSLKTELEEGQRAAGRAAAPGPSQPTSILLTPTPATVPPQPSGTLPLPARPRQRKTIPLVGRIAAGESILAEHNVEGHIAIDEEMAGRVDFALRVKGYSMVKAAILEGDIVVMEHREDPPPNGRIAAVIVPQIDDEGTLKRFYQERDHVRLGPANDNYPLIIVKPNSVSEEEIRTRYERSHPKQSLQIYSGPPPQIAGWAKGLIREEIRITEEMKYQP